MGSFEKFGQQRFSALAEHLESYMEKKDSENLHKIRVDIKKIKAMLLFVNDRVKKFRAHKNYIPLRKIFRRAGEIRDPEVLSGLLLAHNIPGVHDQRIDEGRKDVVERFCEDVPSFVYTANKQWLNVRPLFKKMKRKDLKNYLDKLKKVIKSRLYPRPDMNLIHMTRKSIKQYLYLSEIDLLSKKKLLKFYTKQAEAIGELHDKQVLLDLVSKQNSQTDKTLIKKIRQECDCQKKEIRKAAVAYYK